MNSHILIATAKRNVRRIEIDMPQGAHYDNKAGCWMLNGQPFVTLDQFRTQASKKNDMETGEDQKGE